MSSDQCNDNSALSRRIDELIVNPGLRLAFEPTLEARYQAQTVAGRIRHARLAGWIAVLAYNIMLTAKFVSGEVDVSSAFLVLACGHLLVTLPCVLCIYAVGRWPRLVSVLMGSAYVLVTLDAIVQNFSLHGDAAIYDAFTSVLIIVTCNIALPMPFSIAAIGSAFSLALLDVGCLLHPDFPPQAKLALLMLYAVAAAATLVANYRFEFISRSNFLNFLRESLRAAESARLSETLAQLSRTDFLTGLANRRGFDPLFDIAIQDCQKRNAPLTVLIADIDHFKLYNDRHGHVEGDECLQLIAREIAAATDSASGFSARFGGEEFVIVLPGKRLDAAMAVAERLSAAVRAKRRPHRGLGEAGHVTISVGVALMGPGRLESAKSLLARADLALYRAKRRGRDRAEPELIAANG